MTTKTRLKTKADLAQYATDLEVELAYAERENAELKEQIAELIHLLDEATKPDDIEEMVVNVPHYAYVIAHPGYIC